RGRVHADRRDPPEGAPAMNVLRHLVHADSNRGKWPPVPTLGFPHMRTLVLLRHGESEWNSKGLFTGWVDVGLSGTGAQEAASGGTPPAQPGRGPGRSPPWVPPRAIQTANIALEEAHLQWLPPRRSWRLNERHYGALQGKDKARTRQEFGDEQFML